LTIESYCLPLPVASRIPTGASPLGMAIVASVVITMSPETRLILPPSALEQAEIPKSLISLAVESGLISIAVESGRRIMSPPLPLPDDPSMLEGSCRWRVEAATRSSGLSVTGGFSCPDVGGFGCSETSDTKSGLTTPFIVRDNLPGGDR